MYRFTVRFPARLLEEKIADLLENMRFDLARVLDWSIKDYGNGMIVYVIRLEAPAYTADKWYASGICPEVTQTPRKRT
jgi:hypothetical protein